VQRVPIFLIIALIIVALYYLTPLRDYMHSQYDTPDTSVQKPSDDEEEPFDELSMELLVVSNKLANLEGKMQILNMAREHPDWFGGEEYDHLATVLARTEEELARVKEEYERVKNAYARETALKMIRKSIDSDQPGNRSPAFEQESVPYNYLD